MDFMNGWLKILQQWVANISYCIEQPMQTAACKPFWTWLMIGVLAFGALVVIVFSWKFISYKLKYAAALRAQEARERIDVDAIEAKRWEGDKAYSADMSSEEVERRIKQAVDERRDKSAPLKIDLL